jgi:hypothetical protein
MKKRILGVLFYSMFLLGASLSVVISAEAQQLQQNKEITEATTYSCTISSNSELNVGYCRAIASGGSICMSFGSGPRCSGVIAN